MRSVAWVILIVGGVAAVVYAAIFHGGPPAFAAAVVSILTWVGVAKLQAHVLGLRRPLTHHVPSDWMKVQIVTHVIPTADRANFQLALDDLRQSGRSQLEVFGTDQAGGGLTHIVLQNVEPKPIEWEQFPSGKDTTVHCATNAIYRLWLPDGRPFCALLRPRSGVAHFEMPSAAQSSRGQMELEVAATTREAAEAAMNAVRAAADRLSVYRGEVISIEKPEDVGSGEPFTIKLHDMPVARRDRIVLPEQVLKVVDRNVLGLLQHRETLRRAGRGTRHGVLLHGPPGTGKTLVTRYLANACPDYTVILLNARNRRFVRESCRLARVLAPSMLILEDVDLIAAERSRNRHAALLHALMDEMDGLGSKAECIFLLTTNRPEILEPALAARPGRVDQAIYFPLPDLDCRRRLVQLFSDGLDLSQVDVEELLGSTEGASPAFLDELFRKAALLAAERGERASPLPIHDDDLRQALRELVEFGGDLTRNLLGFSSSPPPSPKKKGGSA